MIYGAIYPSVFPTISALANLGHIILPNVLDVNLWLSILFFVLVTVTLFYVLEKFGQLRKDKVSS